MPIVPQTIDPHLENLCGKKPAIMIRFKNEKRFVSGITHGEGGRAIVHVTEHMPVATLEEIIEQAQSMSHDPHKMSNARNIDELIAYLSQRPEFDHALEIRISDVVSHLTARRRAPQRIKTPH